MPLVNAVISLRSGRHFFGASKMQSICHFFVNLSPARLSKHFLIFVKLFCEFNSSKQRAENGDFPVRNNAEKKAESKLIQLRNISEIHVFLFHAHAHGCKNNVLSDRA
ncbi:MULTISPECIES: hypothetical protein [unclassified Undibacterium]|uniref:hypothetical protein n=1 Tax=unclassified Undibacterium TaxID=2630295 RepID=UPI002AC8A0DD|nr:MULTISPECIES: hypothetical protein [unclassified Undibacterium]MEB0140774.1 hypothetical protein [Undibacterium sp. CCC2.1]MEB0173684.1 hypothetical protein [Undibacterium sp. CCC1.1]MEB0177152.1 hypothetical protein [Undibacterium sp. CCC3.4]MEB0216815.1 hypothetical protein [Undibacterium sp. 5I2]WPX43175.1 hypothetical protein RHM61_17620 [Undibacterium sp. CCC3.4]